MTYLNATKSGGFVQTTTTAIWPTPSGTAPVQTKSNSAAEAFKPKKAGKNGSHVVFILDDSYSMQDCRVPTIEGFNEFLGGQRKDAKKTGIETFVSLYKFDGENVNQVYSRVNVNLVAALNKESYDPTGSTNLYDAAGGVMMQINKELSEVKKKDRPSVIVVLLTDGEENSSRVFNNNGIKMMIAKCEEKNWGFMFLGANIDAFAAGGAMGFGVNNTMQYNTTHMKETMTAATARTARLKSAYNAGMDTTVAYAATGFTDAERAMAVGEGDEDTK